MQMKSVRARLARLEEEIAAFERWQQDSICEHPAKKGPSHDRHDGNVRGMRRARAGRMARNANCPCSYGAPQPRDCRKAQAI